MNKINGTHHYGWDESKHQGFVEIEGNEYKVIVLYSPSRNALRRISKEKRLDQYQQVLNIVMSK